MSLVNKCISLAIILFSSCLLITGCANIQDSGTTDSQNTDESSSRITGVQINEETQEEAPEEKPATFSFVTAQGEYMDAYLQESVEMIRYDWSNLKQYNEKISYEDETYTSRWGVDVSSHNGKIDWEKAKKAGITFAFVRVGYRGYGEEGSLNTDEYALENIDGAQAAGLDVGAYFFSQAVSEEEAVEEADLTLEILDGRDLELPIVYDPEDILNDQARTDTVSSKQFTKNAVAFCDRIRDAGYEPMLYCNLYWEAYRLDLTQLSDVEIWYADYEAEPQTPYHFTFWQYDESGHVDGIPGDADLDLQFLKVDN